MRCHSDALWIAWPKRSSGVPTDLTENTIRDFAFPHGVVDVKFCAVTDMWSGLKLVRPCPTAAPLRAPYLAAGDGVVFAVVARYGCYNHSVVFGDAPSTCKSGRCAREVVSAVGTAARWLDARCGRIRRSCAGDVVAGVDR